MTRKEIPKADLTYRPRLTREQSKRIKIVAAKMEIDNVEEVARMSVDIGLKELERKVKNG